jgi:hypothetical protein
VGNADYRVGILEFGDDQFVGQILNAAATMKPPVRPEM